MSITTSISQVDNDDLTENDMLTYLYSILTNSAHKLTVSSEIEQYNSFLNTGIHHIIRTMFNNEMAPLDNERKLTEMDKSIASFVLKLSYSQTELKPPSQINKDGIEVPRNPDDYRVNNGFYAADLILTVEIGITANKIDGSKETLKTSIPGVRVSAVPVMVKSSKCTTRDCTPVMLEGMNEDPKDTGGYFIAAGKEYIVTSNENLAFNRPLIFRSTAKDEVVRATDISRYGGAFENSNMLVVTYMKYGAIHIKIQATTFIKAKIPFYHIFKSLGQVSDKDITNMIVYDMTDKNIISERLLSLIDLAFKSKYPDHEKLRSTNNVVENNLLLNESISEYENPGLYRSSEDAMRHAYMFMSDRLDKDLLPHIGIDNSLETRRKKMLFIGAIIRDILLVVLGLREEDDRDHIANKRIHGAGLNMAKTFKTLFNSKVNSPILQIMRNEVVKKSFDNIDMGALATNIRMAIVKDDLQVAFEKCITSVEKEGQQKERTRMSGQSLERKNWINVIATLRMIVAMVHKVAKTTKRSDQLRYWHPSTAGIYCPAHTPESGEKVGTIKQLGLTAVISPNYPGLSNIIKALIKQDPELIDVNMLVLHDIPRRNLCKVIIDGDWLGCCEKPYLFVEKYRNMRRRGEIDKYVSIEWNSVTNTIGMYTDLGRLFRPLLIVDNNLKEFNEYCKSKSIGSNTSDGDGDGDGNGKGKGDIKGAIKGDIKGGSKDEVKFVQNIRLTKELIYKLGTGEITFDTLYQMGIVEYIYPGEEVLICPSLSELRDTRHDYTKRWTHCDIEQSIFGITAMTGPYLNMNQPVRNTMVTLHAKQACGQPFTRLKQTTRLSQRFSMFRVETPLVKTILRDIVPPNCQNIMVLYSIFLGYNQEDSSMVNKTSQEIGMLKGTYYKVQQVDLEKNMTVRVPRISDTSKYKQTMSYAKLDDQGFVKLGSMVYKGDIILGVVIELSKPEDGKNYMDRSEQYTNEEGGRVVSIIPKLDGNKRFVSITFEYVRPLVVGDKMSSRAGNKNINSVLVPKCDMPHTEDGMRPDLILNPHSIPGRMTLAQLFETTIQRLCAKKGMYVDGTVYRKFDVYELFDELEREGLAVRERMINGITGEAFDARLFFGPQSILRLPKFVIEDRHAVGKSGPINPMTAQAITGKRVQGGHKVGEMEAWVMLAQGTMSILFEEFYMDSDHKKMYICRGCNQPPIYNDTKSKYNCRICKGDKADIVVVDSCKTSMLVLHEWAAANIKVELVPEGRKFEEYGL